MTNQSTQTTKDRQKHATMSLPNTQDISDTISLFLCPRLCRMPHTPHKDITMLSANTQAKSSKKPSLSFKFMKSCSNTSLLTNTRKQQRGSEAGMHTNALFTTKRESFSFSFQCSCTSTTSKHGACNVKVWGSIPRQIQMKCIM